MRPLFELQEMPFREWTADELAALRRARIPLRRTITRTIIDRPPGYVLHDHDALDMRLLDAAQRARLLEVFANADSAPWTCDNVEAKS